MVVQNTVITLSSFIVQFFCLEFLMSEIYTPELPKTCLDHRVNNINIIIHFGEVTKIWWNR